MTRLIVADEADLMLLGIRTILQEYPQFKLVDIARDADTLLKQIQATQPHLVLFNERLDPFVDVLLLVERIKTLTLTSKLIITGNLIDGLLVRDLFASGVSAYLYTGDDLTTCLHPCIRNGASQSSLSLTYRQCRISGHHAV